VLNNLGRLLLENGDLVEAEQLLAAALAMDRKLKDPQHDDFVYTLNNLALARLGLGSGESVMPLLDEALAIASAHQHRMRGEVWVTVGEAHSAAGRAPEALQALAAARPLLTEDQPDEAWFAAALNSIEGGARVVMGELDVAEELLLGSFPVIAARWGEQSVFTRLAAARLARFHDLRGDVQLAERFRRTAAGLP
jgi:tetratricopeptide (TPR) repeat protein